MHKLLVIQTSFIGDVVLATALIEKLHQFFPEAQIDFLLRKGNEGLLKNHPFVGNVLIWDKQAQKKRNLLRMLLRVRREGYTHIINVHRFASSGLITWLSGAGYKAGFDKNPFSFCYTKKIKHIISEPYSSQPMHEVQRNQALIADLTDSEPSFPRLYPSKEEYGRVKSYACDNYACIAHSSVWFTKQFPPEKWIALIRQIPAKYKLYLLGAKGDAGIADRIIHESGRSDILNLCGKLNFLESAALMESAKMNYVNDSAPLHFASAMHAPVSAVFCSTVPAFGFGPLRDNGKVVEIKERLYCRPCGLHGYKTCPEGHFRCGMEISNDELLWWTSKTT